MTRLVARNEPTESQASQTAPQPAASGKGAGLSPWVWMAMTCVFLGASGGVRAWQDHRFSTVQGRVEASPFPLTDLPASLGNGEWQLREGGESNLDPQVARVAGCTDSLIRTYHNSTTGVNLTVLILFGPARDVYGHTPDICYPAAGYQMVEPGLLRGIEIAPGASADFRTAVFAREGEKRQRREEVYYSFRHGGRWTADASRFWRDFRHQPSMFKVQVQRPVPPNERRDLNNPTEQFLASLMPEMERRIAESTKGPEN